MPDVVATILVLPDDGGDDIIRVDYRLDGGGAVDSGLTAPFIGPFTIPDGTDKDVQWRAVNSVDNDPDNWSDIKTVSVGTISAIETPATSVLYVGDALNNTTNWGLFLSPSNYTTSAGGEDIDTVTANYIGDTADAIETFEDGENNHFSITVTDTAANSRTFETAARTVLYLAPVAGGALLDQFLEKDTGVHTYNASTDFTGGGLTYSISSLAGVTIDGSTGVVSFDTDVMTTTAGTSLTVTATNSGGSVDSSFNVAVSLLQPGTITPIVVPTVQRTYDTQAMDTLIEYESLTDPASYSTDVPGATINTPEIQTSDDGTGPWTTRPAEGEEDYSFEENQNIRVRVTDTADSEYTLVLSTVEYLSQPQIDVNGFGQLDVNEIVPPSVGIPIIFEDDSATIVSFNSLESMPQTVREVTATGLPSAGQTLNIRPPCTAYDTSLGTTLVEVWSSTSVNTIDVSDPHAPTLLIDATEAGTTIDITCTTTQTLDAGGSNEVVSTLQVQISTGTAAWSNDAWSDATDTFTANFVNAIRYDWALYADADGPPTVVDGVWSGTRTADGGGLITANGPLNVTPTYPTGSGDTADRVIFVVSNTSSQDTRTYTFSEAPAPGGSIIATTGSPTITPGVSYDGKTGTTYDWINDGSFTTEGAPIVYYLVVAGGGAGGSTGRRGGGGGAGGMVGGTVADRYTAAEEVYAVTVGAGGVGSTDVGDLGGNGGDSSIVGTSAPEVAIGGGRGGNNNVGAAGGSGGGGAGSSDSTFAGAGTAGQGFDGADGGQGGSSHGGGGGGAGEPGFADLPTVGGTGGDGLQSSITGSAVFYAGGGGGGDIDGSDGDGGPGGAGGGGNGSGNNGGTADPGVDGLGGGGGGVRSGTPGNGGSGRVIVFVED